MTFPFPMRGVLRCVVRAALVPVLAALMLAGQAEAQLPERSKLPKEDGAIYLEHLLKKPLKGRLSEPAPCYANLTGGRWLGNLLAAQEVVVEAISEKAFRVRGRAPQGGVVGWVKKDLVEGVTPEMLESIAKLHERQLIVDELVAASQVALGMTAEEVVASLGKPTTMSSQIDKAGRSQSMEFISYQRVPQTSFDNFGRPSVIYVKVETGRVTIDFENGVVSKIAEKEGAEVPAGGYKIVPPPLFPF